jgi:tRNA pseudouridine38-40 synthase
MENNIERWKIICAYDGTEFLGWQSQPQQPTLQDTLERQLKTIFKRPVRLHGSSRTDAGVHARGQVAHFDAPWAHGPETLLRALKSGLPESLKILSLESAPPLFHSRFQATRKAYSYRFIEGQAHPFEARYTWSLLQLKLNSRAIQEAAQHLIGTHDFTAFGAKRPDGSRENPVKSIYKMEWIQEGPSHTLWTEGSGYLYKMVRFLAGALVRVGEEKITPDAIKTILMTGQRPPLIMAAPPQGLCLERVDYD